MRVLVTGASGFVGCHLVRHLLQLGGNVITGLDRHGEWPLEAEDLHQVPIHKADLCDRKEVTAAWQDIHPDVVYHLAGYADAGESFAEPELAWQGNLQATRNLYDVIQEQKTATKVLYISSGAIYGTPELNHGAIDETSELRPTNPYAASKAAADLMSYQYVQSWEVPIIRARPFNHTGPGQSTSYVISNFAAQIAAIEVDKQEPVVQVGNLSTQRDFTDVRDIVRAYVLLVQSGKIGEAYNIASGESRSIQECLDLLLSMSSAKIEVQASEQRMRKVDTSIVQVSNRKLKEATGWQPEIRFEQTLRETLQYWRDRLA